METSFARPFWPGQCVRFAMLAVAMLLAAPVFAAAPRVLVLNDTNEPPFTTETGDGFLDIVAREAFRRAGVELRLVKLPAERALLDANAGIEDGDLVRIAGLEKQYPNLIRVPEKLVDWAFTAFSKNPPIPSNWPAIRQHAVGYIKGWKIYEQNLAGTGNTIAVESSEQLFRLLALDRIDVALYSHWMGLALIQRQGMKDVYVLEPPLATREMFIYLHKKHAVLAPKIASALRALKAEGFYDRAYREKLLPYAGKFSP
ncbi:MAG TPA: transporter substrate-binding domain-containing protein [Burkholderiales bacterium]|nr:transporter substrate-binding domain-containing protein [Burkholderiales bacterium]